MNSATYILGRSARRYHCFSALKPTWLPTQQDVQRALPAARQDDLWIAPSRGPLQVLVRALRMRWPLPRKLGDLVLLDKGPCQPVEEALREAFVRVALTMGGHASLRPEQLVEVFQAKNRADLFISGMVDRASQMLALWRGDRRRLVVPLWAFPPTPQGLKPDFSQFEIADYGQALRFGDYEAATDAVLYEFDPAYRRRLNRHRRATDKGLGASLRRVRKQKSMKRTDFGAVTAKTIARIERGEVSKPRKKTLEGIAAKLGVRAEDIATY